MLDAKSSRAETGGASALGLSTLPKPRAHLTDLMDSNRTAGFPATIRASICCDVDWNSPVYPGATASGDND